MVTGGIFVGRGARLPFDMYEAEDGRTGGGAVLVGPNRTVGDLAGEASGRRAATLSATGSYVEWTTKNPTNTLVTRFSIPDNAAGTGASGQHRRLRQRHLPQAPRPDVAVRVAVRQRDQPEQPARLRRTAAHLRRGQHAARHHRPRRRDHPPAAHGQQPAAGDDRLHQHRAGHGEPEPEPGAVRAAHRLHAPGRAGRARQGPHGHHGRDQGRLPARRRLQHVEQVPGVRQGGRHRRRRPVVHAVLRADRAGEHRRRLPRGGVVERVEVPRVRVLRQLHQPHRRPRQGAATSPTCRT